MRNKKLIAYVRQARIAGLKDPDIIAKLLRAGWTKSVIDEAFSINLNKQREVRIIYESKTDISIGKALRLVLISLATGAMGQVFISVDYFFIAGIIRGISGILMIVAILIMVKHSSLSSWTKAMAMAVVFSVGIFLSIEFSLSGGQWN